MAPDMYPRDLPSRPELLGAPDWYSFEHAVWPIGEQLRNSFKTRPKLKLDLGGVGAVMDVIECNSIRRGRQSFVMAIGFTAAYPLATRLARFLDDKDIDGQVIAALLKMRVSDFVAEVSPLMKAEKTWIRNLAKKYVQRYSAAE